VTYNPPHCHAHPTGRAPALKRPSLASFGKQGLATLGIGLDVEVFVGQGDEVLLIWRILDQLREGLARLGITPFLKADSEAVLRLGGKTPFAFGFSDHLLVDLHSGVNIALGFLDALLH
jgi:hypothetical protein